MSGKVICAQGAVDLIKDGDTVAIDCSGGNVNEPVKVLAALEERFLSIGHPKELTIYHVCGIGDRKGGGTDRFAHDGFVKRVIGSHWGWSPKISQMVLDNKIEAYIFPQGVHAQLLREIAGGRPGLITHVGLETFVDPRLEGGKANTITTEEFVQIVELNGKEWLFYPSFPIHVGIVRGTTADEKGNISMEEEGVTLEALATAQAAKNSGGIVIAQVKRLAAAGSLDPKLVKIPGILVDAVVIDPDQRQSLQTYYSPSYTGEIRVPLHSIDVMPLDERKVIARRAAMELTPGAVVNLGYGISDGVASIMAEEGIIDMATFSVEQGLVGGIPARGDDFGLSINPEAMLDEPYQFDFYDGGGLDFTFLAFAQVDRQGNVNVSKFASRLIGPGGFINMSQGAKNVVFCATMTAKGLSVAICDGKVAIHQEGRIKKFIDKVEQVTFSGPYSVRKGKSILYVTERAVFKLTKEGIMLIEIAPGTDLERDVLDQMEFKPLISPGLREMDARIFKEICMDLKSILTCKE